MRWEPLVNEMGEKYGFPEVKQDCFLMDILKNILDIACEFTQEKT